MKKNKKVKICISIILLLIVSLIMYVVAIKVKEYNDRKDYEKYYEETYILDNSGDTYEQKLRNIHNTYPPEFYEYVNETNTFSNDFFAYEEKPNEKVWNISNQTCKEKKKSENLLCINTIGFGGENIYISVFHYPPKGLESYFIDVDFSDDKFLNYNIQRFDRMGAYAECTFKDASLTEPVNKIEKYDDPDYEKWPDSPYGEVNCYDEGKLYQDIVPLLEKFEKVTLDNIDKLIKLSEDYKSLSEEEIQQLSNKIELEKSLQKN